MEEVIPLDQCLAGIIAFEVVGWIEQVLATRLALAARERAETVEASGDRADEAALPPAVRRAGPEDGRRSLVGAVRAAETLDGFGRLPTWL